MIIKIILYLSRKTHPSINLYKKISSTSAFPNICNKQIRELSLQQLILNFEQRKKNSLASTIILDNGTE